MGKFIYQLFKKDRANAVLLAIVCLLLCTIVYKEFTFRRWQRCHYGVVMLQTPGVTSYMYSLSAWSSKDSYYPHGVSVGSHRIGDSHFDCEVSDELLLPPDKMCIKWTSVADKKQSWVASIELDKNYLKQRKGNLFAVQLQEDGKVKLYVANATIGMVDVEKEGELKEVGAYQAQLVEPEKRIANVAKELLHITELIPKKKEMTDSISKILDKAFDTFLSATPVANDSMKACISTLLQGEDTEWFEDEQEACRIKKRRANCLLALALLSKEKERDELLDSAYKCFGESGWELEDKQMADAYIGIKLADLLFQLQENPFDVTSDLLKIDELLRKNEQYMFKQQFKHADELVHFCLRYYF